MMRVVLCGKDKQGCMDTHAVKHNVQSRDVGSRDVGDKSLFSDIDVVRLDPLATGSWNLGTGLNVLGYNDTPRSATIENINPESRKESHDAGGLKTSSAIITNETSDLNEFTGNLRFSTNVGLFLTLTADARRENLVEENTQQVSLIFNQHIEEFSHSFNISEITDELVHLEEFPTHICNRVFFGRNVTGVVTINTRDSSSKKRSTLTTELKSAFGFVSANANADLAFDSTSFSKNYSLSSKISSASISGPITNPDSVESLKSFMDSFRAGEGAFGTKKIVKSIFVDITNQEKFKSHFSPGKQIAEKYHERANCAKINISTLTETLSNLLNEALDVNRKSGQQLPQAYNVVNIFLQSLKGKDFDLKAVFWDEGFELIENTERSITNEQFSMHLSEFETYSEIALPTYHKEIKTAVDVLREYNETPLGAGQPTAKPDKEDNTYYIKSFYNKYLSIEGPGEKVTSVEDTNVNTTKILIQGDDKDNRYRILSNDGFKLRIGGNRRPYARTRSRDSSHFIIKPAGDKWRFESDRT
jgi:hypothetical protein